MAFPDDGPRHELYQQQHRSPLMELNLTIMLTIRLQIVSAFILVTVLLPVGLLLVGLFGAIPLFLVTLIVSGSVGGFQFVATWGLYKKK